ncbi:MULTISPECIES: hypothetical protein [Pseudomonas]|uniref:Uncharacterized protein n=1 Tax=Pseudomonas sp. 13.2 TaxID=3144665 RepID=A0AAU7BFF4_9PSED|nr:MULTISPECIES: hypothetical protein [Pseudomonas]MDD2006273.1 hypothetical protein [Pseudomonas putida]QNV68750.1 hypothetical protein F7661_25320 [Pseudomonas sp. CFA]
MRDKAGTTREAISATIVVDGKAHLIFEAAQRLKTTPQSLQKSVDREAQEFIGAQTKSPLY